MFSSPEKRLLLSFLPGEGSAYMEVVVIPRQNSIPKYI